MPKVHVAWWPLLQLLALTITLTLGVWQLYGLEPLGAGHKIVRTGRITIRQRIPDYVFPNGGRTLLPNYRLIALYGTPDTPDLGVLGVQPLPDTLNRVKALAAQYQPLMSEHALPTLEIVTTIASGSPEADGSYSRQVDIAKIATWAEAAKDQGIYVVLDLQSGRSSFLSQAQQYEAVLKLPNVGLALDPEWRLAPDQLPLQQIGSVDINEVNQTAEWLAGFTRYNRLPQKLFLLHQFRLSMLPDRDQLNINHPELGFVVQMDGQGGQDVKLNSWRIITNDPSPVRYFGWKNFYHEDTPVRSPEDIMALNPKPWYVSYQ